MQCKPLIRMKPNYEICTIKYWVWRRVNNFTVKLDQITRTEQYEQQH